ncbi:MAG TPA: response regulator, partial [Bacteroidales bacterium]|nr:response regulator [Bacteroidales bacterium]
MNREIKILIVDDDQAVREGLKMLIGGSEGFQCVAACASAEEALEIIPGTLPDVVLMDINLGQGQDGTQVASRILALRDLPLIFLSSHTERDVVEKTEGISSYGYIVKNSGETVLIASIKMAFRLFNARLKEKEKDTELRAYAERLLVSDKIFIHSIDMLCIAGFDGYFKVLNPSWERTLGWSTEELLSKPWIDFVHPEDRDSTGRIRTVLVEGRQVYQFENRYLCKNGEVKWLSWNSFPYPDENLMFGVARDVS